MVEKTNLYEVRKFVAEAKKCYTELHRLKIENIYLMKDLKDKEDTIGSLQQDIFTMSKDHVRRESSLKLNIEQEIQSLLKETKDREEVIENLLKNFSKMETRNFDVESDLKIKEMEIKELTEDIECTREHNQSLVDQYSSQKEKIQEL